MASPLLMLVTRAGIWFRALSCMIVTPETLLALLARSAAYRPTLSPASPASREAGHGRRVTMRAEAGPGERLAMPARYWRGRGLRLLPQPRRQRPSALSNASAVLAGTRPAPATATTTSAPERAQQCQRGTGGDTACACYRNHDVSARARSAMPARYWRGRGLRLLPQPRRQRPSALSNASAVLAGTRPAPATATTTSAPERAQQCQRGTGGDAACACYRNHDGGWAHSAAIARQVQPAARRLAT